MSKPVKVYVRERRNGDHAGTILHVSRVGDGGGLYRDPPCYLIPCADFEALVKEYVDGRVYTDGNDDIASEFLSSRNLEV